MAQLSTTAAMQYADRYVSSAASARASATTVEQSGAANSNVDCLPASSKLVSADWIEAAVAAYAEHIDRENRERCVQTDANALQKRR